jgi:hypothetical protein
MTDVQVRVKRKAPSTLHPKDWERRARVVSALSERRMTTTELAAVLNVTPGYVSSVIWGRRRLESAEKAIAEALNKPWEDLFGQRPARRGIAA